MRPMVCLLVLSALATACAPETPETATLEALELPATTATSRATTTITTVAETTTTTSDVVALDEIDRKNQFALRRGLDTGTTYLLEVDGLEILLTPLSDGWELLGYLKSGSGSGALFGWDGPNGFRSETLDVLIWDVGDDGLEAAWDRVDGWLEAAVGFGGEYQWLDDGVGSVAGIQAEWREMRSGDVSADPGTRGWRRFTRLLDADLWLETSARFYVAPIGDLTITLAGYETRCACQPHAEAGDRSVRRGQKSDDVENELSMWIPELEAFLASMSFEAP